MLPYAPGSRVVIRDEEWLVRRVDPSSDGGHMLTCDGVSPLVRGRLGIFLSRLDRDIQVLDPADTKLVKDDSSNFDRTFLYLEAKLRRAVPNDDKIRFGHRAVMNLLPYQLDPALQALRQPRQRILIADAVGLGKTLEAGILATELIQRGRGRRILVITQKSMLTQFQKEFWCRFTIPLVRLDSLGLQRVRNTIPSNHNPFNYYDRSIISVDTLKTNLEYRNYLESAWWDIIIIDECHNVAARAADGGVSDRARLARLLSGRSDTLVLLSATPHDGTARSFASLLTLLDPTSIGDPDDYTLDDFKDKGLVIRRFKKDIRDQVAESFQERITERHTVKATPAEEAAYRALLAVPFTQRGERLAGKQHELQRVGLQKALFSSPAAALESVGRRISLLSPSPRPAAGTEGPLAAELSALDELHVALRAIGDDNFSRYNRLLQVLRSPEYGWDPANPDDRLVIFSERLATLQWLKERLAKDLKMPNRNTSATQAGYPICVLDGSMSDIEQQEIVDRFGRADDPIRILLCSDVASEGLNLHYRCHRLFHFDLPWSLMVFQQRNGRVDRYGQKHRPRISYLFTETEVEKVRGDLRILEILQEKEEQATRNLGDPASLLNLYDAEKEANRVSDIMVAGKGAEAFEKSLDDKLKAAEENKPATEADSWLMDLCTEPAAGSPATPSVPDSRASIVETPRLFGSASQSPDFHFFSAALKLLGSEPGRRLQYELDVAHERASLTAPEDLVDRLRRCLPAEVRETDSRYVFTTDAEAVEKAIQGARQASREESSWPDLHYLWPQHPVMEWVSDRVLSHFGRLSAPVVLAPGLPQGHAAFLVMGLIPNRKGQPLLAEYLAVVHDGSKWSTEPMQDFLQRHGLKAGVLPNPGTLPDTSHLSDKLKDAIAAMSRHMLERQKAFEADTAARLKGHLDQLKALQSRQLEQLELRLSQDRTLDAVKAGKRQTRTEHINRVFDDYKRWVEDTLSTEPKPFIEVLAAVTR